MTKPDKRFFGLELETGDLFPARGRSGVRWSGEGRSWPGDGDHHGDRGRTNPPEDQLTEAKLTRDLRNANDTATQPKRDVNCADCA